MKVYISGQISGMTDNNKLQFSHAENLLRFFLHKPVNPLKIKHKKNATYNDYLKKDLRVLKRCKAIYMLKGWEHSKGAVIEHEKAKKWRKEIIYER